jgi:acyl-CoA dehydrogenase
VPSTAFALTEEQQRLADQARRVARQALRLVDQAGTPGRVNRPLVRALGDQGLLPRLFPKRVGGAADGEVSAMDLCVLREALARESTSAETALAL